MSDPKSPRSLTALAVEESVHRCLAGGHWRNYSGPSLEMLTDWFKSNLRQPYVRFCSSGTIGVELALRSLHLQPGDEVLLCGYDYPGNFRVIEDCHAKVVLCEPSKSQIWSPDIESLEQSVAPATRAIIVSHLHGELATMDRIVPWARDRGIVVIEDACQAIGGTLQNRPVGSWGDLSVFSFGGSKLVSAGRGGVVLTSNPLFAQRMTRYSEKGNDAFAISELQAAALVPQCERLKDDHSIRSRNAEKFLREVSQFEWLRAPRARTHTDCAYTHTDSPAYYKLGLLCDFDSISMDRERALWTWKERGIVVGEGFPGFANRSRKRFRSHDSLEATGRLAASTIVFHHSHLLDPLTGESSVDRVLDAIAGLAKGKPT
jgi:dTDP-4-amino-4,6-dideoxygalactose transaminase